MLFEEQISRKPDLYPWSKDFIDAMHNGHWTVNEFNFNSDIQDFKTVLTEQEKEIVVRTLSAIGQIEVAVKKFWAKLGDNLPHPSITDLGYVMANTEVIHNQAYERLLESLGITSVFEENLKNDIIKGRVDYLRKYLEKFSDDQKKQYIYAIILFTLFIENVSLFSQFYIILWFGRFKNVLKDTNQQVLYTKNEELIHAQVGMKIINTLRQEYPELFDDLLKDKILTEAVNAFKAECNLIDWIIGDYSESRINADVLKSYVAYKINESLQEIGYKQLFTISDDSYRDFEWMNEETLANNNTDFFYKRPVNYSKNSRSFCADELF